MYGPQHAPTFLVTARVTLPEGSFSAGAEASNKKQAEQLAARYLLMVPEVLKYEAARCGC